MSTDVSARQRQARGTSAGGQFATEARTESDVALRPPTIADVLAPADEAQDMARAAWEQYGEDLYDPDGPGGEPDPVPTQDPVRAASYGRIVKDYAFTFALSRHLSPSQSSAFALHLERHVVSGRWDGHSLELVSELDAYLPGASA